MSLHDALVLALQGQVLTAPQMRGAITELMSGQAEPLQAAALLASLATRGESVQEVTGAAQAMLEAASAFPAPGCRDAIDTCGTGGDGAGTFNISTAASFVVAACGAPVCKHGNRAVSSKSGSADLLEALGARIDLPPEAMARVFERTQQAFLFAPTYHPAVRHVMPVRRGLAVRTLFNLLGPVINPAQGG
jgi:anthranilate phosphoribosyltransferase